MFNHGPSCLNGPVSRERPWWTSEEVDFLLRREQVPGTMNATADLAADEDRPIRWELVERVRREIASGTYATPEKLQIALERMLDRLRD